MGPDRPVPALELRRAAEHRRMPWANGGGWTSEIVAWPDPDRWQWRLSIADVVSDGPFSTLPGVDRTIALLDGRGFRLRVGTDPVVNVDQQFCPFEFAGDAQTVCELIDGPVADINLMARSGGPPMDLSFDEVQGTATLRGIAAAMLAAGEAESEVGRLHIRDAVVMRPSLNEIAPFDLKIVTDNPAVLAVVRLL